MLKEEIAMVSRVWLAERQPENTDLDIQAVVTANERLASHSLQEDVLNPIPASYFAG